jgi:signal transduction histidine kinase
MLYLNAPHQFTLKEIRPVQTIASQIAFAIEQRRALQEVKKAHEEILEASRAKDNFLATLSHELRTPLNPILLVASDAINNATLPPDIQADFEMIRKNVELEARLIDDLLDLTRITHGKITLDKKRCDVHSVLKDAISNICDVVSEKQISLDMKLDAPEHTVFADSVRLHQVFGKAMSSAISMPAVCARLIRLWKSFSVPSCGWMSLCPPSAAPMAHGLPGSPGWQSGLLFFPLRKDRPIGWIGGK